MRGSPDRFYAKFGIGLALLVPCVTSPAGIVECVIGFQEGTVE